MAWVLCKSIALVLLATSFSLGFFSSSAELPRFHQDTKADGSLSFLVVGDWGRKGAYNQTKVAEQMGKIGEKLDIDFIISTGDNFYEDGLKSVNDPAFEESFTDIYTADGLKKQWYTVLGNHDYRGDVLAQLSPVLTKIDSRWLCLRSFILDAEIVEFFFVDTTPFVKKYWDEPGHNVYDWRDVSPRDVYIANLLKDLQSALKESSSTWKIVVGHHTMRSAGHHGDTKEIVELILPLLTAYNVDFYVNGHDHCLEHVIDLDSPLQFLTSGGGSKAWRGDVDYGYKGLQFYYDGQGFMSMQLTKEEAKIVYYDVYGNMKHTLNISKQQYAAI